MVTTLPGPQDELVPDPEDWPSPDPADLSPEAVQNETDDLAAGLPVDAAPSEADEADLMDQLREVEFDDEDRPGPA